MTITIQGTIHIQSLFMVKIIYYLHNGLSIYIGHIMKSGYLINYSISLEVLFHAYFRR